MHGVLTFYHDLHDAPTEHQISICLAEACQAVGARELEKVVKESSVPKPHDGYCFGNCALGPAAMVDGKLIGRATLEKIEGPSMKVFVPGDSAAISVGADDVAAAIAVLATGADSTKWFAWCVVA